MTEVTENTETHRESGTLWSLLTCRLLPPFYPQTLWPMVATSSGVPRERSPPIDCHENSAVPSGEEVVPRHEAGCRWGAGKMTGSVMVLGAAKPWCTEGKAQAWPPGRPASSQGRVKDPGSFYTVCWWRWHNSALHSTSGTTTLRRASMTTASVGRGPLGLPASWAHPRPPGGWPVGPGP